MRRSRKAKIIATLGPASSDPAVIESLFLAGADIFRLNFSHGTHEDHKARLTTIRELEAKIGRPIAILADLQGPKLRVGKFAEGKVQLTNGQSFRLDLDPKPGDVRRAPLLHPEIFAAMTPGIDLLLDDGRIKLRVESCNASSAETRIVVGGVLSNHKGVNVPGVVLPISPLTPKDLVDLEFALSIGADWIALSFVQRPTDVIEARDRISALGGRARIISKLEKPYAVEHLKEIVELSDALMVARGDLGVECPAETVPILQKRIVRACRAAGRPVVVATQMLESMISAPTPTRAEASDVATAVYDGADAVMLSAETASGAYPVEAVKMMDSILGQVEKDDHYRVLIDASRSAPENTRRDAISQAAREVAHTISGSAIVTYTSSGSTALRTARERPEQPVISITSDRVVARQMELVWGVHSVLSDEVTNVKEMVDMAIATVKKEGFAANGERIVIIAGVPFGYSGSTNLLRIAEIE
jgi:pyruvate kinase